MLFLLDVYFPGWLLWFWYAKEIPMKPGILWYRDRILIALLESEH